MTITFEFPLRIISVANAWEHWRARVARQQREKAATMRACYAYKVRALKPHEHAAITLTRVGPRTLDDDNVAGGFKSTRDQIANHLGVDDGSDRLRWVYRQAHGKRGEYAVRVSIEISSPAQDFAGMVDELTWKEGGAR